MKLSKYVVRCEATGKSNGSEISVQYVRQINQTTRRASSEAFSWNSVVIKYSIRHSFYSNFYYNSKGI